MRFHATLIFTTLVLAVTFFESSKAFAAKEDPSPDIQETPSPAPTPSAQEIQLKQSLDFSPAPPLPKSLNADPDAFFYSYHHALTFRAGPTDHLGGETTTLLGSEYQLSTGNLESYELGADLLSDGTGAVFLYRRNDFSRGKFRPYVKGGAGFRIVPDDQLVTFVKYQNWQLRLAGGLDELIYVPSSIRVEFEVVWSSGMTSLNLTAGYVWAW